MTRAGNGRSLRKVPSPGNTGSSGSPTGESPSSGADTTQPGGTVMRPPRRLRRDLMKRPPPREQAPSDGVRCFQDRRGERAVECCLNQKGAYYHDLAGSSGNWRAAGQERKFLGREPPAIAPWTDRGRTPPGVVSPTNPADSISVLRQPAESNVFQAGLTKMWHATARFGRNAIGSAPSSRRRRWKWKGRVGHSARGSRNRDRARGRRGKLCSPLPRRRERRPGSARRSRDPRDERHERHKRDTGTTLRSLLRGYQRLRRRCARGRREQLNHSPPCNGGIQRPL